MGTAAQIVIAALGAFAAIVSLHKPAPRPTVTVYEGTDAGEGGVLISVVCPTGYGVKYPDDIAVPSTAAERISVANRAVCVKRN